MRYIVNSVVSDYGIFKVGESEPIVILNSLRNALLIARILDKDCSVNPSSNANYVFTDEDYNKFVAELNAAKELKRRIDNNERVQRINSR